MPPQSPHNQYTHFSVSGPPCPSPSVALSLSLFAFPLSPLVHTFLSVLPSWSTRFFCWFSEQQFGPSEGQRQVKFCFDDSKWRDYPNERQLSKPHPSLSPSISLCLSFPIQSSYSTISGYSSYSLFDFTCTLFSSLLLPNNVFLPSSSQPFIPSSLTFSFIFRSLYVLCLFTCQNTLSLFSTIFYSCLFFPFLLLLLLLPLLLSSFLKGAINWTGHKGALWKRTLINIIFLFWG